MLPMSNHYVLHYEGKEPEETVIKNTQYAKIKLVKEYGENKQKFDLNNNWKNKLIYGDNLTVLKTLLRDFTGKIKLIYIDPPFSTNTKFRSGIDRVSTISSSSSDEVAYEDILGGVSYLEFIRKRLIFLRELLSEDGSIYFHIDSKKGHYIKVIMDEIFGEENFINDISRIKCKPKNFSRRGFGNIKDMILFYAKTNNFLWNESREEFSEEDVKRLYPKIDTEGRRYTTTPLHAPGETSNGPTGKPWKGIMPPKGRHWRCSPEELTKLDEKGLIEWSSTGNPRKIIYAKNAIKRGKLRQDIWEFRDPQYPIYPTEKNSDLLDVIILASSNPKDVVLDCFCGSGTTLQRAELHGRRWIGIDNSELAIRSTIEKIIRIKNLNPFVLYSTDNLKIEL